jgi:uncharacterized membrane protein YeaQ/YmgE (transglycosylase-associated protein family)
MLLETLTIVDLVIWMLFGLVVGLVVHLIDQTDSKNVFSTVFFGILGSLFGGLISSAILYRAISGYTLQDTIIATAGAITLAIVYKLFVRDKQFIKTTKTK